jgi:hypothetical protein
MDTGLQSLIVAAVVPVVTVALTEFVRRSGAIGQVRIDDRGKLTTQLSEELAKAILRAERCEDERREQDRRLALLEAVIPQVSAEARVLRIIVEPVMASLGETDTTRVRLSITRLEQLAQKIEEDEEPPPTWGIGAKE